MDITDRSIANQVTHTIEGTDYATTIDVNGVVRDIIDTYGLVDIDDIDDIEYWPIIARHDSTQNVVPTAISCNTCNHLIRVDKDGHLASHKSSHHKTQCPGSGRHYSFVLPRTS